MVGSLIRVQHFICSVHALMGSALRGRARALPVGIIVNKCFFKVHFSKVKNNLLCVSPVWRNEKGALFFF